MIIRRIMSALFFSMVIFASVASAASSFNRMIFLIDEVDEDKESAYTLRDLLLKAIDEQAASVFVSKNVFLSYLKVASADVSYRLFNIKGSQYVLVVPSERSLSGLNISQLTDVSLMLKTASTRRDLVKSLTRDLEKQGLADLGLAKIFIVNDKKVYWNFCLFGHGEAGGRIAGTDSDVIRKLFGFFNTSITTNLIYIASCFLGGSNKILLLPDSAKAYNFVLVLGSSSESRVVVDEQAIRFNDFFNEAERGSMRNEKSLGRALHCLTYTEGSGFSAHGLSGVPQLYDKKANDFKPLTYNKKIAVMYAESGMPAQALRSGFKKKDSQSLGQASVSLDNKIGVLLMHEQYQQVLIVTPSCSDLSEDEGHLSLIPSLSSLLQNLAIVTPDLTACAPALKAAIANMKAAMGAGKYSLQKCKQVFAPQGAIFPAFLSMTSNQRRVMEDTPLAVHYFRDIRAVNAIDGKQSPFFGIARFLRDSFMDASNRDSVNYFLIKKLSGFNDFLPMLEIYSYLDKEPLSTFARALVPHKNKEITLGDVVVRTEGLVETDEMAIEISFSFASSSWHCAFKGKPEDFTAWWCWDFAQEDGTLANTHRFHQAKRYLSSRPS